MYQALYRAYRPEVFEEILGQEHIVRILKNQIATNSTSHAYIFCGTRGTGKTTTARLLAKGLNCLSDGDKPCGECENCRAIKEGSFIDVIEIDAASNNGVENIRELRESVNYPPAIGKKKIYIIDEVHMLTTGAFNALLKTLEEPPEYVTFILATTEMHKLPSTILSRCMRLDFKRVPELTLISGMKKICTKIGIDVSEDALRIIAANADGSVRDGLSILDQCISGGDKHVDAKDVLEFLGASSDEDFIELTDMVRKKRTSEAIAFLAELLAGGKDVRQFNKDWINHYRNLLMVKFVKNPESVINMADENIERIRRQSSVLELEDINRGILELSKTQNEIRWSTQPRLLVELAIIKLCLGAGEIRELSEFKFEETEEKVKEKPKKKPKESSKEKSKEKPQTVENFEAVDEEKAPEVAKSSEEIPEDSDCEEDFDCEEIWNDVFEDGEAKRGSFYLVRSGGTLTSIDENDFTVVVGSAFNKELMEKNRELLEELMQKHTNKHRIMRVSLKNLNGKEEKTIEEIASEAGDLLGVKVDIE